MKRLGVFILALMLTVSTIHGQKVGLVLSGGGAKGIAHVGMIQALEENDIPIDYVVGTSMGAIIGSLYSMGYTPDQMIELIISDEFKRWYGGASDNSYRFFFRQDEPTPSLLSLKLDLHDSLIVARPQNISLVNPRQMNLGFVDVYAGANAVCNGNFNNLMVPFRCVGSDVYNKRNVVMSEGDLGNAVRASMTFPFVFKPIKVNGQIVYDGGIYDNFPHDVMSEEFHPDFMIGSIVSGPDPIPAEDDLYGQLRSMIIQENDNNYRIPADQGITLEMSLEDIKLLDFHKAEEIARRGYFYTIARMDSIKSRISSRRSADIVDATRESFKKRVPELVFRNIIVSGVSDIQAQFIEREFRQENGDNEIFDYEGLKKGYFRLLSDNAIKEIIPSTSFDTADSTYTLSLDVTLDDKPSLHIGGGLSTSSTSQLYVGLSYRQISDNSMDCLLEGQVGRTYNNAQLTVRFDVARRISKSLSLKVAYSNFNYYNQKYIFTNSDNPAFNKNREFFTKMKMAMPFLNDSKVEFSIGGALHNDYYSSSTLVGKFKYDESKYNMLGATMKYIANTHNTPQYPTSGHKTYISGGIYTSGERFLAQGIRHAEPYTTQSWIQIAVQTDAYTRVSNRFTIGNYFRFFYSTRGFSDNYSATMMQAGRFEPTVNSTFIFNNDLRANEYLAYGFKPIYHLNRFMHLRGEFYGFLPLFPILKDENQKAYYGTLFSELSYMGEISLVAKYERISANIFLNLSGNGYRCESPTFGITIGYLLPGERFIED